jgi:hypothetical protein
MKAMVCACMLLLAVDGSARAQAADLPAGQVLADGLETFCKPWLKDPQALPQADLMAARVEPLGWTSRQSPDGPVFVHPAASGMVVARYAFEQGANACTMRVVRRGPADTGPSLAAFDAWLGKTFPGIRRDLDGEQAPGADTRTTSWRADDGVSASALEAVDASRRGLALLVDVRRKQP